MLALCAAMDSAGLACCMEADPVTLPCRRAMGTAGGHDTSWSDMLHQG